MVDSRSSGNDTWAAYLQRIRRGQGWTIQRLADEAGVGRSTIQDWLANGGSERIKIETIVAIARAVGDHPVNAFLAAAGLVEAEPQDEEIGMILKSNLTAEQKQRRIQAVEARRDRERHNRMQDTQEFIREVGGHAS